MLKYSRVVISAYLLNTRVSVVEICEIMPRLLLENRLYNLMLNIINPWWACPHASVTMLSMLHTGWLCKASRPNLLQQDVLYVLHLLLMHLLKAYAYTPMSPITRQEQVVWHCLTILTLSDLSHACEKRHHKFPPYSIKGWGVQRNMLPRFCFHI